MNIESPRRAYRQSARAASAEATGERIADAFLAQLLAGWFDEIRLEDVAREAGVTVQTVLRRFGSKEQLLVPALDRLDTQIRGRRQVEPGDLAGALTALVEDYEAVGDLILRLLAQEERYPGIKAMTDTGRAMHRRWTAETFARWLVPLAGEDRRRTTDALVVACDLYVWKLLRRDLDRPIDEYRTLVETLCAAALGMPHARLVEEMREKQ